MKSFVQRHLQRPNVIQVALLILVFSLGVSLWLWKTAIFTHDDAIFYLVIAKNLALDGHQTFSGIMSTNGAHPLWLYLLTAYSWVVAFTFGPDFLDNIKTALPLSVALLAGGCIVWWKIGGTLRINQFALVSIPLTFTVCAPVLYTEMHLLFFTLSLLVLSLVALDDQRQVKWFLVGALSALVILSRLDTVFTIASLVFLLLVYKRKLSAPVAVSSVCAVLIIPYLASNYFIFGHIVPVSGYTKSSFPDVNFTGFTWSSGPGALEFQGYSVAYGIVPILLALALWPIYKNEKLKFVISTILGGAILQFAQIALFASSAHNQFWYYLLPIMAAAIAVARLLSLPLWQRSHVLRHLPATVIAPLLLVLAFFAYEQSGITKFIRVNPTYISISKESLTFLKKDDDLPDFWPPFYDALDFINAGNIQDSTIVVSDTPGGIAFYNPSNRVIAADFLTGNVSFLKQMRSSDNAFRYLFDSAARLGKPIEYVMVIGGLRDWLSPSPNRHCVLYFDPMRFPDDHLIGQVHLGSPAELVKYGGIYFIAWRASSPKFDIDPNDPLCLGEAER